MPTIRRFLLTAALFLEATAPQIATAQSPDERTAIGVTVLSAWGKMSGMPTNKPEKLFFEPGVLRGWWENGTHPDTTIRRRDAAEIAKYTSALVVQPVTPEITAWCAGRFLTDVKPECTSTMQSSATAVLGDPHIMGDTATVLLRTGALVGTVGNNTYLAGRQVSLYLVKLVRRDNRWAIHCATFVQGDGIPKPSDVEARCRPANGL